RNLSLVLALVNDDRLPLPIDLAPAQSQYLADPFLLASRCFGCKPEYVHVLTAHLLTHIDLAEFVLFSNLPNAFQALACCSGVERYCDQFDVRLKGILDVAAVQIRQSRRAEYHRWPAVRLGPPALAADLRHTQMPPHVGPRRDSRPHIAAPARIKFQTVLRRASLLTRL